MRTSAIIVTLGLLAMPVLAQDVYRSVDEQGNVIYSDRPDDRSAVKVAIAAAAPRLPVSGSTRVASASEEPAAEPDEETIAAAESAQLAQERAANCETARQRRETYTTAHRLYRVGDDGERVYYSAAEMTDAQNEAVADIARWCN